MDDRGASLPGDGIPQTLFALTEIVQRRLMVLFKETGLHWGLRRILQRLWMEDGLSQAELARAVRSSEASASNMLKHLVRGGWVERRRDRYDYRISRVYITEKARTLRDDVAAECARIEEEIRATLSDEPADHLAHLLDTAWRALSASRPSEQTPRGIGIYDQPSPPGEL